MWMETLRLTSSLTARELSDLNLLTQKEDGTDVSASPESMFFTNPSIPGDLMIIVRWEGGQPEPSGSHLGLRLVRELKRYGLVDHGVWVEGRVKKGDTDRGNAD